MDLEHFETSLVEIPWFLRVGAPIDVNVGRLSRWDEWPGPEDPGVAVLHVHQQSLFDDLLAAGPAEDLEALFNRINKGVMSIASTRVPFDENQDAWHAPTTAVWHAGWTAAILALSTVTKHDLPDLVRWQWRWFLEGHWPAGLRWKSDKPASYSELDLIVF